MKETDIRNPKVLDEYVRMVAEETARTYSLSTDTFYLVFLDRDHRFYKMEAEQEIFPDYKTTPSRPYRGTG